MPRLRVPGATLALEGSLARLALTPRARATLAQAFREHPEASPFAILTEPAEDAWLVWSPGQAQPEAITAPGASGASLSAHWLAIVPDPTDDGVRMIEDGAGAVLAAASYAAVRTALTGGAPLRLGPSGTGELSLEIAHAPEEEPGWITHWPEGGERRAGERIVLLSDEATLRAAIEVEALSRYVRQVLDTARPFARGAACSVRVVLAPGAPPTIALAPIADAALARALGSLPAPQVRARIAFEVQLSEAGASRA